ncbi:GxxExxY protein [Dyadobacter psychrotolerans]|uniref:GxxExxY protein n=1 Tax=Dyadobacter psychrotolerans TaxID=2541721 RepID=A0A4R5DR93_9BACT|nr:GxxExxY protein [Dyadobacter psychrotolerans]TDE16829.1 GxxExxY protein [Dyadobacter psychrotolerans]
MITRSGLDPLEYQITGACIEVHKHLGPGLLESVYQQYLSREFQLRNIPHKSQHIVSVHYKGVMLDTALRTDFLIGSDLLVELKAIESILPIHEAQILAYMKLLKVPKGLLMNFNCTNIIHHGKKSYVNELYRELL